MALVRYLLISLCSILCILASLPIAAQCETSYYEKYYSARRFLPIKRPTLVQLRFLLKLPGGQELADFEQIALVGNRTELGSWQANEAILLNKTTEFGEWSGSVMIPVNTTISYRYFVATIQIKNDSIASLTQVQIRRWESDIRARRVRIEMTGLNITDVFGKDTIDSEYEYNIRRGWLNAGHILQFTVIRSSLQILETAENNSKSNKWPQLRLKLQPVDPQLRTPITDSARAYCEYVRFRYGDSHLRKQPEFGVPYEMEQDTIIFHVTVMDLSEVAYLIQLYVVEGQQNLIHVIGYQYIYTDLFNGTENTFTLSLLSPIWSSNMGSLQLRYVDITPLPGNLVDFHTTFTEFWPNDWMSLEIGHRGLGKSLKLTTNVPPATENTLASMQAAAELGADLVEFDVHLTKDLIPIIYHDFGVFVCMHSKTPTSTADLTQVLIKDITYEQLKDLKTYQVINSKIIEYPSHNSVEIEEQRLFPTLESFLTEVDKTIGFNIEIKWPLQYPNGTWQSTQTIDKNLYVDRILEVMYEHGCGRFSVFSSFDGDICTMLRFKQNIYPVLYLQDKQTKNPMDTPSQTIYNGLNTAQAFDFIGIVAHTEVIKSDPKLVQLAFRLNKKILLYGSALKSRESVDWFMQYNITGAIYDHLDLYLPRNRAPSAFQLYMNDSKVFESQCAFSATKEPVLDPVISKNMNML